MGEFPGGPEKVTQLENVSSVGQRGWMHAIGYWYPEFLSCLFSQVFSRMGTLKADFVQWTFIDSIIPKIFIVLPFIRMCCQEWIEGGCSALMELALSNISLSWGDQWWQFVQQRGVFWDMGLSVLIPGKSWTTQKVGSYLDPTFPGHGCHSWTWAQECINNKLFCLNL